MKARELILVVGTAASVLLSGGITFGYSSLKLVFLDLGVYSNICLPSPSGSIPQCTAQYSKLDLMNTLNSGVSSLLVIPSGWLLDRFGQRPTFAGAHALMIVGLVMMALSLQYDPAFSMYTPAYVFIGLGGLTVLAASFQVSSVVSPSLSHYVSVALNVCFDISSAVFSLFEIGYFASPSSSPAARRSIAVNFFYGYITIPALSLVFALAYMPKKSDLDHQMPLAQPEPTLAATKGANESTALRKVFDQPIRDSSSTEIKRSNTDQILLQPEVRALFPVARVTSGGSGMPMRSALKSPLPQPAVDNAEESPFSVLDSDETKPNRAMQPSITRTILRDENAVTSNNSLNGHYRARFDSSVKASIDDVAPANDDVAQPRMLGVPDTRSDVRSPRPGSIRLRRLASGSRSVMSQRMTRAFPLSHNSFVPDRFITSSIMDLRFQDLVKSQSQADGLNLQSAYASKQSLNDLRQVAVQSLKRDISSLSIRTDDELQNGYPCARVLSFQEQLRSPLYTLFITYMSIVVLGLTFFLATITNQLRMYDDAINGPLSPAASNTMISVWGIILPVGGVVMAPLLGFLLSAAKPPVLFALPTVLTTLSLALLTIPSLPLQYLTFVVVAVMRPIIWTLASEYISQVFGFTSFGRLYGILLMASGIISFVVYGLNTLALSVVSYMGVNLAVLAAQLVAIVFPVYLYRVTRGKRDIAASIDSFTTSSK
ncbi:hypothetical protein RI367_005576 [Sorochytrium milnesiophthora]